MINNNFVDTFDNQNCLMVKDNCSVDCENLCANFLENKEYDKYNKCRANCKNVLTSCGKYCANPDNINSLYCGTVPELTILCPKVYKKDGNYIVYVQPNSYYAKLLNYSGEKSYGSNQEKARYTYNINFPKCAIPVELLPGEGKHYNDTCPFIINELNPCFTSSCAGVNWNVENYNELKLNKNCKKAVSNYCQINFNIDDKCKCWDPRYKDDPQCLEMRKYFEDPKDYCSPNMYKIEDHPDFNKYIKKDNIPCWGCNLNM